MAKLRIYELAKELGVENREVLTKAQELGMKGKSSHSHSLEPDEADQIRRAIIRNALGSGQGVVVASGAVEGKGGEITVEHRRGNIIRRRKEVREEGEAAPIESTMPNNAAALSEQIERSISEAAAAQSQEPSTYKQLDALFKAPEEPETTVEESEPVELPAEPEQPVVVPEAAHSDADAGLAVAAVSEPVVATHQPGTNGSARKFRSPERPPSTLVVVARPAAGPKVLGKIELPQRKVIARAPDGSEGSAARAVARPATAEDEGAQRRKEIKGRAKKKEFSRGDLLDYDADTVRRMSKRRTTGGRREDDRGAAVVDTKPVKPVRKVVKIGEVITVGELAKEMSLKVGEVISKLIELGVMATINQGLDADTAAIVAGELGYEVERVAVEEEDLMAPEAEELAANLLPRPPVVTVMGHVDHGKTTLLDTIRKASVAAREHGGITQHIGAYKVLLEKGQQITFIDTPGHEAFTSMRARGAKVTDIVILVVAADDGVMPQTREALDHAKAAGVPIVVAVNKVDKPGANPDRVKTQLAELGLQPEDWGGDTMFFPVSGLKGTGVKEMLEGMLLVAEVKELKANPNRHARGAVIEARADKKRGTVATVLVQQGTLKVGDPFISGATYGRVRSMEDELGDRVTGAAPSIAVEITGFTEVPMAGDDFIVVDSDAKARQIATIRALKRQKTAERGGIRAAVSLEEFAKMANSKDVMDLNLIIKADVHGSVEAVRSSLEKLTTEKVRVRVVHASVGAVTESDIQLAIASKALIVGFGVRAEPRVQAMASNSGIEMRFYNIIYEMIEDVQKAMLGLLAPTQREKALGRAEVRNTFNLPKIGMVAGCYVLDGLVRRNAAVRLLRDSRVVHQGKISGLKRFKDDAREVAAGLECGISIERFNDIKVGDVIEAYEMEEVAATLN